MLGGFVDDPQRAQRLSARSFDYARRATCIRAAGLCARLDAPFEAFQAELAKTGDVAVLYALASAWAGGAATDINVAHEPIPAAAALRPAPGGSTKREPARRAKS